MSQMVIHEIAFMGIMEEIKSTHKENGVFPQIFSIYK